MAIKINGTDVIDDSKNFYLNNITFSDASTQNTKPIASVSGLSAAYTNAALLNTIDNPNAYSTSAGDEFGVSVAISGNYAIVGAWGEDDASGSGSGKAYIFNVTTGALLYTLNNPNPNSTSTFDQFGYAVAISGNYAIVSANNESDAGGGGSGKAYIFNVTTGTLLFTLNNPNAYSTSLADNFGISVAISGNYAIVGARDEDDAGGADSGKAYIYNVSNGQLLYTLNNPTAYSTSATDYFGWEVAVSGNYAIVSAIQEDDTGGADSGKAYIYNVTTGALLFTLNNPNAYSTSLADNFGISVAISGNYAIVGAWGEDDASGSGSGKAYIFNVTTGALLFTLNNPNAYSTSDSDFFGYNVSISGNYAIVGAYQEDDAGGATSGKAYIYNVTTGALLFTLNNPNAYGTSAGDIFGTSVAISGNYAIVSASYESDAGGTFSGKAYIFNIATSYNISQVNAMNGLEAIFDENDIITPVGLRHSLANPNAYSTSASDTFGNSVAISGNYAIVSAWQEDDAGGGISGKAYIYNVSTGALLYTLNNPTAYSTSAGDEFGYSVAIDGNYAIVGAYNEDDAGGAGSGKAYVYNVTTGALLYTLNNPNAYSTSLNDNFGLSVAISGNYAIVSAYLEDDTGGGASSGKAYIYNVTTGALLFTLNNPNAYSTSASDLFGRSVAISGNYAIVGARQEDDAGGAESGKAYIYNVTTGALVYTLNNPTTYSTGASDNFGNAVAISGNYAIVGAFNEDDSGGASSGKAYIYNVTTGALLFTLNNPNAYGTSASDVFGDAVAISGNYAIVGARNEDDLGGAESGKAYIYDVTTGALVYTLNNPTTYSTGASDQFAISVAISGNYAIVGAYFEDDLGGADSGRVYIYNYGRTSLEDRIVSIFN